MILAEPREHSSERSTDVLIIGAGFAGASAAFHLSRNQGVKTLVVEREGIPGFHASGRNASLLLQSTLPESVRQLTIDSRKAYEPIADRIGFRQIGSVQLGSRKQLEPLRDPQVQTSLLDPDAARRRVPLLNGHDFEGALWTPSDGVIDISRLLDFYLQEARSRGTEFYFNSPVLRIEAGRRFRVECPEMVIEADRVVNAAGAWAPEIGTMAGATRVPMVSLKRHLFILETKSPIDESAPFVWSQACDFYFRPESGGLLFSVCDEIRDSSLQPTVDPEIGGNLAELIFAELPGLQEAEQRSVWSCFRTKTTDLLPVLGPDPRLRGFFWVAGLGGHGMGASWEIGRLVAETLQGEVDAVAPHFLATRFLER